MFLKIKLIDRAEQPYQHSSYHINLLMAEKAWSKAELLDAAEDLDCQSVQSFIRHFMARLHLVFLIHGNLTKQVKTNQLIIKQCLN